MTDIGLAGHIGVKCCINFATSQPEVNPFGSKNQFALGRRLLRAPNAIQAGRSETGLGENESPNRTFRDNEWKLCFADAPVGGLSDKWWSSTSRCCHKLWATVESRQRTRDPRERCPGQVADAKPNYLLGKIPKWHASFAEAFDDNISLRSRVNLDTIAECGL